MPFCCLREGKYYTEYGSPGAGGMDEGERGRSAQDKLNNPSVAHFCDSLATTSSILIASKLQSADM